MRRSLLTFFTVALCLAAKAQPLRLLPQNPHYFLFRGKPTVIVGSGEHYGAVLNGAFDYKTYLQTLHADGLNTTRLFTGAYYERPGAFGIQKNTMAPAETDLMLPWQRSGSQYDLTQWNGAFFNRLRDFVAEADRRGVLVEVTLFSSYYGSGWAYHPFNRPNNVNSTDEIPALRANTLQNGNLLAHQERYVRKIVRELNGFDNVYFEIQNEPWADLKDTVLPRNEYHPPLNGQTDWRSTLEVTAGAANDWQRRVAGWIADEEKTLPKKHLIAQNIGNFHYPIVNPDPAVSIFNFHYALPDAVTENYHLNRVIGFNETGFGGSADATYRRQAWRFMLAGGGLFDHLDYSFSLGSETGQDTTYRAPGNSTPGGGSPALRRQFSILKAYLEKLNLAQLKPDRTVVTASPGAMTWALQNGPGSWVVYVEPVSLLPGTLHLRLPAGTYRAEWTDVVTGEVVKKETVRGGALLTVPVAKRDVVVTLSR